MSDPLDAVLAAVGYLLLIGAVLAHMFGAISTRTFCLLWTVGMTVTCVRSALNDSTFAFWTGLASLLLIAWVWLRDHKDRTNSAGEESKG